MGYFKIYVPVNKVIKLRGKHNEGFYENEFTKSVEMKELTVPLIALNIKADCNQTDLIKFIKVLTVPTENLEKYFVYYI